MHTIVAVLGMGLHVVHSTKGRVPTIISTCNQVNKNFSLKQSPFQVMYLTLKYYISLDGVTEGYGFLESYVVMLQAIVQDSTTCTTRRLNHLVFVLFIQMLITLFLKLLAKVNFSVPLHALLRVSVISVRTYIQGFQKMDFLCRFNLFPNGSMYGSKLTGSCSNLDFVKTYQIHHIILTKS